MRKALLCFLLCFALHPILAQGPGGVGTTNSSNDSLAIWLRADSLVTLDGSSNVTNWGDLSGNGNNFASTSASFSVNASGLNSRPTIDLNGSGRIAGPTLATVGGISGGDIVHDLDVIVVFEQVSGQSYAIQFSRSGSSSFMSLANNRGNTSSPAGNNSNNNINIFARDAGSTDFSNWVTVSSEGTAGDASFAIGSFHLSRFGFDLSEDSIFLYRNDQLLESKNDPSTNITYASSSSGTVNLGAAGNDSQNFDGEMAEFIVFNDKLSEAAYTVVANYLNARYGTAITLGDDFYTSSTGYEEDVIGIGSNGSSSHMTSTGAGGGFYLTGTTGIGTTVFDNNEWLFAGHNGGSTSTTTSDAVGNFERLQRIWRMQQTETDGFDVTFTFDLDELGLDNAATYTLFGRAGTSGSFTDLAISPVSLGNTRAFSVSDTDLATYTYFTLAVEGGTPGGISIDLLAWYSADAGVSTTGSSVDAWTDRGPNMTDANDVGALSALMENSVNFYPSIDLEDDANALQATITSSTAGLGVFVVYKDTSSIGSGLSIMELNGPGGSHLLNEDTYGTGVSTFTTSKDQFSLFTIDHASGTSADLFLNGTSLAASYSAGVNAASGAYTLTIGENNAGGNAFEGEVAEIIIYEGDMTPTEINKIETYLAIKYGLALGHTYISSADVTVFDPASHIGYNSTVAALNLDAASGLNNKVAKAEGDSLIIATSSDFTSSNTSRGNTIDDGDYFFISSNGAAFTTTLVGTNKRLDRIWKVTESETSIGTVNLALPESVGVFDSVLVSTDPTFTTGVTRLAVTQSGGFNTFTNNFTSGQYFTFTQKDIFDTESSDLRLWLRADIGVTTSGSTVTGWADQTDFGHDADNDDSELDADPDLSTIAEDPVDLQDNALNFSPAIRFAGADRPISGTMVNASGGFTFFFVGRNDVGSVNTDAWFDSKIPNSGASGNNRTYFFGDRYAGGANFTSKIDESVIYSIVHPQGTTADIYDNGGAFQSSYSTGGNNNNIAGTYNYVLGDDVTSGNEFTGIISEFMAYQGALSNIDREVVESYLAMKYGLRLNHDYYNASQQVVFDIESAENDDFENNIAFLAREDLWNFSQKVSKADTGSLIIALESDFTSANSGRSVQLNDEEFFAVSSNIGTMSMDSSYNGVNANRIGRKWKVNETNNPGTVFVAIPDSLSSNLNLLIVSSDSVFTAADTEIALSSGGGYYYTSYNFSDGDYFTFASSTGPGGVTTNLELWLKADRGVDTSGGITWEDQSGNMQDQSDATMETTLADNRGNFNPALVFSNNSSANTISGTVIAGNPDLRIFTVFTDESVSNSGLALWELSSGASAAETHVLLENSYAGGTTFSPTITKNEPTLLSINHPAGTIADLHQNGADFNGVTYTTTGTAGAATYTLTIGAEDGGASEFTGDIQELVIFNDNSLLTASQVEQVESYLAIKYGITLTHDYLNSDGILIFDVDNSADNDGFENGIVAITRDLGAGVNQLISTSSSDSLIIALESDYTSSNTSRSTSLEDQDYVFVSHNGGNFESTLVGSNRLLNRVWKVRENAGSTLGNVFLGVPNSVAVFDSLWVSNDTDFTTGVTKVAVTSLSGFNSVSYDFSDGQYFTFSVDNPLDTEGGNLLVWLRSDAGVATSGTQITLWEDQTNYNNDADNDDSEFDADPDLGVFDSEPADLSDDIINFNPSAIFADQTRPLSGSFTSTVAGLNFFVVGVNDSNAGGTPAWFDIRLQSAAGTGNGNDRAPFYENRYGLGSNLVTNIPTDTLVLFSIQHPSGNSADLYQNGSVFELAHNTAGSSDSEAGAYSYVVGDDATAGNEWTGEIAEFLVIQGDLDERDREVIESYLGIKYGIVLGHDYLNSSGNIVFDIETTENDNFENEIVFIARDDVWNLNQKISKSDSGELVLALEQDFESANSSRTTSLTDGQYFGVGHNGAATSADSTYRSFAGARVGRKWIVRETGSVGAVYLGISDTIATDINVMIVSTDSTFSDGVEEVAISQANGFYFVNYDFSDGEYFSFARSIAPGAVADGLQLWLKADADVTAPGNNVSDWADQSGAGNHMNTPATDPNLITNGTNFNPAIGLDPVGTRLQSVAPISIGKDSLTLFIVGVDTVSATENTIFQLALATDSVTLSDTSFEEISYSLLEDTVQLITVIDNPDNANFASVALNGGTPVSGTPTNAIGRDDYVLAIGDSVGGALGGTNAFGGLISEIILYDEILSASDQVMIESYLAVKYGITVGHDVVSSEGDVAFDFATSTGYTAGMTALGFDERTCLDQQVSSSVYDSLTIATSNDFTSANTSRTNPYGDRQYLVITNNEAGYSFGESYKGTASTRLSRVWKVSELSNPGTVYMSIPKSALNPTDLTLVISNNEAFNSGLAEKAFTDAGSTWEVSYDFTDGQFFTFVNQPPTTEIWYSYKTGVFSDDTNWTLDGAISALLVNPYNEIPSEGDTVIIKSGQVITSDLNGIGIRSMEILGQLDLSTTGGHDFNYMFGSGRLRLAGNNGLDNYPLATDTLFYDFDEGGTTEYYGGSIELDTKRSYRNLILNLDDQLNIATMTGDSITVVNNLTITQGELRVNDNVSTSSKVVTVNGDLLVEANGEITVNTANARHELDLYGDFVNQGNVAFTNRNTANYSSEATDGIIDVNFLSATQDQALTLQNRANFYRISIDKGVDDTYVLEITSTSSTFFNLYGPANDGHPEDSQLEAATADNENALGLFYGTVKLGTNVDVPVLNNGGNYNISEGAQIWVDGGSVAKNSGTAIVPYGTFRITSGSIEADISSGITLRGNATLTIEGGTVTTRQFRTSVFGIANQGGLVQSGGVFNVTGQRTGGVNNNYYPFNFTYTGNVFNMSGGELNVSGPNGKGGMFINSNPENVSITGGTVTLQASDTNNFVLTSRAEFYNLVVGRSSPSDTVIVILGGGESGPNGNDVSLSAQPLYIINDLTLQDTTFNANGEDVFVTGTLTVEANADMAMENNTLTFQGEGTSFISIENGNRLELDSLVINKTLETELVRITNATDTSLLINSYFNHNSGQFDYGADTLVLLGELIVSDTLGVSDNTGEVVLGGSSAQSITSNGGFVYDVVINNSAGVSLNGGLVMDSLVLDAGIFDLNSSELSINSDLRTNSTFSNTLMIQTSGNDSDGGLSMYFDANETLQFPLGTDANGVIRYTPVSVTLDAASDNGFITLNPVDTELELLNQTVANSALTYYWRSRNSSFTSPGSRMISYVFDYINAADDVPAGDNPSTDYIPGWVTSDFARVKNPSSIGLAGDNITANTITTDTHGLVTAKYTAALETKFDGTIEVYYNRSSAGNWNDASSWSSVSHTSNTNSFGTFPGAGDVVNLANGDEGSDNSHYITVPGGVTVDAAEVIFDNDHDDDGVRGWGPRLIFETNNSVGNLGAVSGVGGQIGIELSSTALNNPTVNGDFGSFNGVGESDISQITNQFIFFPQNNSSTHLVPTNLIEFPNLRVHGPGGSTSNRTVIFPEDITVYRDVRIDVSVIVELDNDATGDMTIGRNLQLGPDSGGGELIFQNNGTTRTVTVGGDLRIRGSVSGGGNSELSVEPGGSADLEHRLIVGEDISILNNSRTTFDLFSDNIGGSNVILELNGETNSSFTSVNSNVADLFRVEMNKGTDTTSTFQIDVDLNLNGPNTASPQSLELQNGKLILNNAGLNIELADASEFLIPEGTGLEITQGTVTAANGALINLDGLFRINGGTATLSSTDIEYSNTGEALIDVSGGSLTIGNQLRRPISTSSGILKYRQSAGDVIIGADGQSTNARAMFEVLNAGSEFSLTGGTFTIQRGVTGDDNASLNLDPDVFYVSGSTITLGNASTPAVAGSNFFNVRSNIALNNVTIFNDTDFPDVRLYALPLTVNGTLEIQGAGDFLANGFDVTLNGDLTNAGTFTNATALTTFSAASSQSLSGAGTFSFFNLTKSNAGTFNVDNSITITNDMRVESGIMALSTSQVDLLGDAYIESAITNTTGGSLNFSSSSNNQNLYGLANNTISLGKVEVNNPLGVDIVDGFGYNFDVTEELALLNGVFNVGGSLVTIKEGGIITGDLGGTAASNFSINNMVQTNSSFVDNGLKIEYPTLTTGDSTIFFPVGEQKYTPVSFALTNGSEGGSIRVRPANERHPTVTNNTEPNPASVPPQAPTTPAEPDLEDITNVLQYYWIVVADGITGTPGVQGSATFFYNSEDISIDNNPDPLEPTNTNNATYGVGPTSFTTADYISARLLSDDITWDKFNPVDFDESTNSFVVPLDQGSGVAASEITGDYTAGVGNSGGNTNANATNIEGAIPDQIQQYVSVATGSYGANAVWDVGVTEGVGPVGGSVTISAGDVVEIDLNNVRLYETNIEQGGTLVINSAFFGHRLGNVSGNGTIRLQGTGTLPAGEYSAFFDCSGGALDYSGSGDYSVLGAISQIRKVSFTGTDARIMPNNILEVCDTLDVNGPTLALNTGQTITVGEIGTANDLFWLQSGTVTLSNSTNLDINGSMQFDNGSFTGSSGTNVSVYENITRNAGTIDWNNSVIAFDGAAAQTITGDFQGTREFDNLTINNSSSTGVTVSGDVEVSGTLTLTDGHIYTSDNDSLVLDANGDYAGASSASHIKGPLVKQSVAGSSNYEFPVGKSSRYAPVTISETASLDNWKAEYFTSNSNGTSSFDPNDPGSGFQALTEIASDMWTVESGGPNSARIRLTYGPWHGSSDQNSLRVVWWDTGQAPNPWWENQGGNPISGSSANGTVTSENSIGFTSQDFTLGAVSEDALPVEMLYFQGIEDRGVVQLDWATATEINNDYFEIQRSQDGNDWEIIGVVIGSGTTIEEQTYDFTDFKPYVGDSYYRLRQVDFDGQYEYTEIILVQVALEPVSFNVYPNPVHDVFNVEIRGISANERPEYQLISLQGRLVTTGHLQADQEGRVNEQVSFNNGLPAGIYILSIETSKRYFRFNLIKK